MSTEAVDRKTWLALAALWFAVITNVSFPFSGSSVIAFYMAPALHLSRSAIGVAFGLRQVLMGVPAPLAALLVSRIGARPAILWGGLTLAAADGLMALFVHDALTLTLLSALTAVGVLAGGFLSAQTWIAGHLQARRALAISVLYAGASIGSFIAPILLNSFIAASHGRWRLGWWLLCAATLASTAIVMLFVRNAKAAADAPSRADAAPGMQFGEVLRQPVFWLMFLCPLGLSLGFPLISAHGIFEFSSLGFSASQAAYYLGLMQIFYLAGIVAFALLGDRLPPRLPFIAANAMVGLGFLLLAMGAPGGGYPVVILIGGGVGASIGASQVLPATFFGPRSYSLIIGLLLAWSSICGGIGDAGAGYTFDRYHNYAPAMYVIAGLCFAGAILSFLLVPPSRGDIRTPSRPLPASLDLHGEFPPAGNQGPVREAQ